MGKIGFAKDPRRINVALSRAQKLLIIVGCSELYCENNHNKEAKEYYKEAIKELPLKNKYRKEDLLIDKFLIDKEKNIEINLKYIDPSYQVRASVTTASDSIYCERLGNNAVHAAMAGKTKCVIGLVHDKFVHLPIKAVTAHRNAVDPEGSLWRDALDATGQPVLMVNDMEKAQAKMAAAVAGAKSKPSEQKKSK